VTIKFKVDGSSHSVKLNDVKYAPEAANNIISIGRLTAAGHKALFEGNGVKFKSSNGIIFAEGVQAGYMFKMKAWPEPAQRKNDVAFVGKGRTWDEWH
ncbi:hypothetical protein M422DRAFT_78744, partial [Sphaerobolus stellatus SS14]